MSSDTTATLSPYPVVEDTVAVRVTLEADGLRTVLLGELVVAHATGEVISREHGLLMLCEAFLLANRDQHGLKGRQRRVMVRDNFTCCAPGCTCRYNLQAHHIVFRSHGGSNDDNEIVFCVACHLRLVHAGFLKVTGTAGALVFEAFGERFLDEMRF